MKKDLKYITFHKGNVRIYYIINDFRNSNEKKTKNDKILKKELNFILNRM